MISPGREATLRASWALDGEQASGSATGRRADELLVRDAAVESRGSRRWRPPARRLPLHSAVQRNPARCVGEGSAPQAPDTAGTRKTRHSSSAEQPPLRTTARPASVPPTALGELGDR